MFEYEIYYIIIIIKNQNVWAVLQGNPGEKKKVSNMQNNFLKQREVFMNVSRI